MEHCWRKVEEVQPLRSAERAPTASLHMITQTPARSSTVGRMSEVTQGTAETRGVVMTAGHSMSPGPKNAPSPIPPLKPLHRPLNESILGGMPLSELNQSRVLSATPSFRNPLRSVPIERSIAVISAKRCRIFGSGTLS